MVAACAGDGVGDLIAEEVGKIARGKKGAKGMPRTPTKAEPKSKATLTEVKKEGKGTPTKKRKVKEEQEEEFEEED